MSRILGKAFLANFFGKSPSANHPTAIKMIPTIQPVSIQKIGNELAVAWSDGKESYLPLENLRRKCPCAACCGEPDVTGYVEKPAPVYSAKSFDLTSWQVIGGYAIEPTWADGHHSGLYSYPLLRSLGEESGVGG